MTLYLEFGLHISNYKMYIAIIFLVCFGGKGWGQSKTTLNKT